MEAADRLFTRQGFHATRLDAIAAAAGYTKGAVYSNFRSKEDLFFAVYERRAERGVADIRRVFEQTADTRAALRRLAAEASARRGGERDGWLSVFYEFWAHVLRHPEHRARFADIHARAQRPFVAALEAHVAGSGARPAVPLRQLAVAMLAMVTGLSLERLVQPDVVDAGLSELITDVTFEQLVEAGRG
ncbi:MAG TPA: TetR/AcrR family transcriptional regulator [Thermoleophilaceae bacterium]